MCKNIRNSLYPLSITAMILIALMPIGAALPSETSLHVVPSEIINTSIDPGDLFVINITVTNVVNLYNWQIRLYWTDPDLLNCTRAWLPADHIFDGMSPIFIRDIHNDTGYVECGACVIPSLFGVVTADEGLLCQIEFEVEAKGSCNLEFSEPYGEDTFLRYALPPDYLEEGPIEPVDYENGYFRNVPAGVHDVAITDIMSFKTVVGQGFCTNVTITVENQGGYTETFNVTAYYNETPITLPNGKNHTTITLTSGNSTTVTFTWNTTGVAKSSYTVTANATPILGETDTADNTLADGVVQVVIPGDVNGNGKVDMKDTGVLCLHYGQEVGDPEYVPNYDVNCDGKINMKDIGICSLHYGEKDP